MPSVSLGRGLRVVAEMLSRNRSGYRATSLRSTVDLPTPEGPERTIRREGGTGKADGELAEISDIVGSTSALGTPPSPLLNVLNLFANPLKRSFYFDHQVRNLRVIRL